MLKIIYLTAVLVFFSCDGHLLFDKIESPPPYKMSNRPQIYLSRKQQFMDIAEINRKNVALDLSDRIVFSDKQKALAGEDLLETAKWLPLEGFPEDNLKIKISSFCSYKKQNSSPKSDRVTQEIAAGSYQWSFAVFDLLPKKMLLSALDQNFYCSFIFVFKDKTGGLNHYNISQQIIEPLSPAHQANKLSLLKRTSSNHYAPVDGHIQRKDIDKISLLNNTGKPVKNYYLFCEGSNTLAIPDFQVSSAPIFSALVNSPAFNQLEGARNCRFFSKDDKGLATGMTNSFVLDFSQINKKGKSIDWRKINRLVMVKEMSKEGQSWRPRNGESIPINSYFYFRGMDKRDFSPNNNSINITVKTSCVSKSVFRTEETLSETYTFPFRLRFPVMAVTPRPAFAMGAIHRNTWTRKIKIFKKTGRFALSPRNKDRYKSSCVYRITLRDRYKPEIYKKFADRFYFLFWTQGSYGIDYIPFERSNTVSQLDISKRTERGLYKANHTFNTVSHQQSDAKLTQFGLYSENHTFIKKSVKLSRTADPMAVYVDKEKNKEYKNLRGKFARLSEIYKSQAGYLKFNFFDVLNDPFLQRENPPVDRMVLKCHSGPGTRTGKANSAEVLWSDSIPNDSVTLKALFSHPDIRNFIKKNTLALCRFFLYEDKILRYFSGEMKITI